MRGDGVGGCGGQVAEAAFGDEERGEGGVDVRELESLGGGGGGGEEAQVARVDVVGWGVQGVPGGGDVQRPWDLVGEGGGTGDGGDFGGGVGGEVEFVVEEMEGLWGGGACAGGGETEEAGVGAGAEGDDLFFLGGLLGEEEGGEAVDCGRADVGACFFFEGVVKCFFFFFGTGFVFVGGGLDIRGFVGR